MEGGVDKRKTSSVKSADEDTDARGEGLRRSRRTLRAQRGAIQSPMRRGEGRGGLSGDRRRAQETRSGGGRVGPVPSGGGGAPPSKG